MVPSVKKSMILVFVFALAAPAPAAMAVTLLSPNGDEILATGSTYEVEWQASAGEATFELKYSTKGGKQWKKISRGISGTSYDWTVPLLKANSNDCRLLIIGYSASGKKVSEDMSDESFAIEVAGITSPAAGETLAPGSIHAITWVAHGTPSPVGQVLLKYSIDNGKKWIKLSSVSGNPGSYDWEVPWLGEPLYECKVMVELRDEKGKKLGQGVSDDVFSIGWTAETFSEAITAEFGEDGAFDALALATDKGYSLPQIVAAATTGRIGADGVIMGDSGKAEKPDNPPTNFFVSTALNRNITGLATEGITGGASSVTLEQLKERFKGFSDDIGVSIVSLILVLYAKGYTIEQILVEFVLSDNSICQEACGSWRKSWHSNKNCDTSGYRWAVGIETIVPHHDHCTLGGYVKFHDCPGGGRAEYRFTNGIVKRNEYDYFLCTSGTDLIDPDGPPETNIFASQKSIYALGQKSTSLGKLGQNTPHDVLFKISPDEPPEPNYAP